MSIKRLTLLAILVALVSLGQLTFNIYLPSIPNIAETFQVPNVQIQYTITFYLIAFAIGQLFTGMLSDRFGRKPVLLVGLSIYAASSLFCFFSSSLMMLIIGRIFQALGGCTGFVIARAIVRDLAGQNSAASMLGYVTMAMVVAPTIAPTIGGYLTGAFGWQTIFIFLLAFCLLTLLAVKLKLPETNTARTKSLHIKEQMGNYGQLLRSVPFLGYALTASFASGTFFAFASGSPHILINTLGLSPAEYGAYFAFGPAGFMVGNFISGRLSVKYGTDRLIDIGNFIAIAGAILALSMVFAGYFSPLSVCAPFFMVTLSNGLVVTNSIAGVISVNPKLAGTAAGLAGFMQMTVAAIIVSLTSSFQDQYEFTMFFMVLAAGVMALLCSRLTRKARAEAQTSTAQI